MLAQLPVAVESLKVNVGLLSHASLALGELNVGEAGHSMVPPAPTPLITGAVLSSIVKLWLAVLELLQASFAVQVRVTV